MSNFCPDSQIGSSSVSTESDDRSEAGIGGRAGPYRLDVGQELVMLTETSPAEQLCKES